MIVLQHPSHGKVHMVMYFRDFGSVRLRKNLLLFKILTVLDMFTAHYNPANAEDILTITFDSAQAMQQMYNAIQHGVNSL